MEAWIIGGGYVTAKGFGMRCEAGKPEIVTGDPQIPKGKEIFKTPLARYGRFDRYTKLGCAGIALAIRDAALDQSEEKKPFGIVLSTAYESYASDIAFYETTKEAQGSYSSPNLFSYTLPGIVLGEMAIHFKMTGPTFIVGEHAGQQWGMPALKAAFDLLESGTVATVIAGWLDSPPQKLFEDQRQGSVFVALSKAQEQNKDQLVFSKNRFLKSNTRQEIMSVLDLF